MSSRGPLWIGGPGAIAPFPPHPLNPALASPLPPETVKEVSYDAWRTAFTGICPGAPTVQHLHLWPANHRLQKVCICWRSSNHACWWRLAGSGRGAKDMATVSEYLQTWKLKLSTSKKTVSAAFHLNNKEAKCELKVKYNNETLPFCSEPKYLGVTLDRSLTYRRHLESLRKKLTSRFALLRRLADSGWGAGATTLQIANLAMVYLKASHCIPVWCRSAQLHTRLIDLAINDALRIVTGCLRPKPDKGVRKGVGVLTPPLSLKFAKMLLPAQRRLILFAYFLLVNLSTYANCTEKIACKFKATL